ncbi:MAG TPA: S1 RNA-binding domain-containing protein, partial [Candidatus Dormibacteraeota bacterium]|nr:S1 RNA-binding domain-containing protein [Candidatus Dormibacteraeota bacterium]
MTAEPMGGTDASAEALASTETAAAEAVATTVADEPAENQEPAASSQPDTLAPMASADGTEAAGEPAAIAQPAVEAVTPADVAEAPAAEPELPVTVEAPADEAPAEAPAAEAPAEAPAAEAPAEAPAAETLAEAPAAEAPAAETPAEAPAAAVEAPEAVEPEAAASPVEPAPVPVMAAAPRREGPEPTTMEELLSESAEDIRSLKHGDVVEGSVVRIDKDEILVDIGAKSEGVVSNRELFGRHAEQQPVLNVGDTVLVYVLQPESEAGHAVLSLRRAGLERKWRAMQEQFEAGVIIEAPVIDHNKGGLIVDCGIRGFVPISQIVDFPRRPQNDQPRDAAQEIAEKLQPFVGRKLRLKILEVNRKANRLILSEKVALYEERREKRDELFSSLQVGQKVTGTVRSIAPFGVFIDLGGIDGLVHKSELSWNKVNNPEAGYKIG